MLAQRQPFPLSLIPYHVPVLVFLQQRHSHCWDDSPLDVQDCCRLALLRIEFHIINTLDHNLQRVSGKRTQTFLSWLNYQILKQVSCLSLSQLPLHLGSKGVRAGCRSEHRVARCVHVDHLAQAAASGADDETTCLRHFDFNLKERISYFKFLLFAHN